MASTLALPQWADVRGLFLALSPSASVPSTLDGGYTADGWQRHIACHDCPELQPRGGGFFGQIK